MTATALAAVPCVPPKIDVFWADWTGWALSNVGVAVFAPCVVIFFVWLGKKMNKENFDPNYFAPFQDGQLAYVGIGWAASAFAEIVKHMAELSAKNAPGAEWVPAVCAIVLLVLMAGVNAWVAGVNAIGSANRAAAQSAKVWSIDWWANQNTAFAVSLFTSVVALTVAAWSHKLSI